MVDVETRFKVTRSAYGVNNYWLLIGCMGQAGVVDVSRRDDGGTGTSVHDTDPRQASKYPQGRSSRGNKYNDSF